MSELEELRQRIRALDQQLLHGVAARLELAREIARCKKAAGVPLRDWEVERRVLDHAAESAAALGISPQLGRALLQLLIAESRAEQERAEFSTYRGALERIAIVGGSGRMGRWLADFFRNQGHAVTLYDVAPPANGERTPAPPHSVDASNDAYPSHSIDSWKDASQTANTELCATLSEALDGATVAVVATPLTVVPATIAEIAAQQFGGVVFDIASLKSHLRPALDAAARQGLAITSIHPLFGPGARTLSDKVICICDCGNADATLRATRLFSDTAATLVPLSLEEHDRIMAYVLGLSHLINVIFATVLSDGSGSALDLQRVGSTTFHSQMVTTATVVRDNAELYHAIQRLNPFTPNVYATLRRAVDAVTAAGLREDSAEFVAAMRRAREWLGDEGARA